MIRSKRGTLLSMGLLLSVSVLAFPAQGTPAPEGNAAAQADAEQVVSSSVSSAQYRATRDYWTRDRMMRAHTLGFPEPIGPAGDGPNAVTPGPRGKAQGSLPDRDSAALARRLYPEEWEMIAAIDSGGAEPLPSGGETYAGVVDRVYNYPPPFTRYTANQNHEMWQNYPWQTVGRLFFTVPGRGDASCSAAAAVRRAVWTAGHCVFTKGAGWHRNMTFVPAYRNGAAPFGRFAVSRQASLRGWTRSENQAYDIGMVTVNDIEGRTLGQWVGYLGASWNHRVEQFWHSNGYPGNIANGRYLITCEGSLSSRWDLPGPDPVGMGCDMTHGSSGGPWWTDHTPYKAGPYNFVNSVVSGTPDVEQTKEFFGPYFGNGARNLYNWGKVK